MAAARSGTRFFNWWRRRGAMAAFRTPKQTTTPVTPAQGQFFRWGASDLFRWGATDRAGWA